MTEMTTSPYNNLPLPTPPLCEVPHFEPFRIGGARRRLASLPKIRWYAISAGLAAMAAALAIASPPGETRAAGGFGRSVLLADTQEARETVANGGAATGVAMWRFHPVRR
ncbi:hypothetical protein [Streptomyces sp. Ru73]|uniref:hypothetical protein n=1 Tax=Streptomyces sp. Ru73 TaxID=2080748 RepID=UPI0011B0047D|nr:hypothetical protein [Streptomyces sp. Ru73]